MCSNFQPIKRSRPNFDWVEKHFNTPLPDGEWRDDAYPTYPAPFIYLLNGRPHCDFFQFGLMPHWAPDKKRYGLRTYNARGETVSEKPTYRSAWQERRFGLILIESFYEPNYEVRDDDKSVRYRIKRTDDQPQAAACIWEKAIDTSTGEVIQSFSMLTINATQHPVMKHFHRPENEKRSIVVLQDTDYLDWLYADHEAARELLQLAPDNFLKSEQAPKILYEKKQSTEE